MTKMTKEMFMDLFSVTEDSQLIEYILERYQGDETNINWWEEAKGQISTMNFLLLN